MNTKPDRRELEDELFNMMWGHYISGTLYAVAELAIADHLKDGYRTADEIAAEVGCHARSLYRLMRALVTIGIFTQDGDRFALTPLGNLLRSDTPNSQRGKVIEMCRYFDAWAQLTQTVKTGTPPKENVYDDLLVDEESAVLFYDAMDAFYYDMPAPMLGIYDFSGIGTVADIGGGSGSQLIALLRHFPHMNGFLFDLPDTVKRSQSRIDAAGLAERCKLIGGSFFDSIPGGADLYLLRHVIHNWNDAKASKILSNVCSAMPKHGRVVVIEIVFPSGNGNISVPWRSLSLNDKEMTSWWDLSMFVVDDGAERTEEEFTELFDKSGLTLTHIIPTKMDISLIEGIKRR